MAGRGRMMSALTCINTSRAALPLGHYSQAVVANGFVFVSGLLGISPSDETIVVRDFEQQVRICLDNLKHIVEEADSGLSQVIKVTVYLDNVARWADANHIYSEVFGYHKPARAIVPTRALHHGFEIEIEAVALVGITKP